jgi:hypothetical protein
MGGWVRRRPEPTRGGGGSTDGGSGGIGGRRRYQERDGPAHLKRFSRRRIAPRRSDTNKVVWRLERLHAVYMHLSIFVMGTTKTSYIMEHMK